MELLESIRTAAGVAAEQDVAAEWLVAKQLGAVYGEATDRERYEAARAIIAAHYTCLIGGSTPSSGRTQLKKNAQFVRDLMAREPKLVESWAGWVNANNGSAARPGKGETAADIEERVECALAFYEMSNLRLS